MPAPLNWYEVPGSREGNASNTTRKYRLEGVETENDVYVFVYDSGNIPDELGDFPLADFNYQEVEEFQEGTLRDYDLTVNWGIDTGSGGGVSVGSVSYRFNFQMPGGLFKQSLATISSVGVPGPFGPPNYDGRIGVVITEDGGLKTEGVQVSPPNEVFTLGYRATDGQITGAYQNLVNSLCGKVNSSPFRGYAAGEIMLVRVNGGRSGGVWDIEFGFGYIANAVNIPVGGSLVVPAKDGFDLLWTATLPQKDDAAKLLVEKPFAAYVERIFYRADLNQLNLPS